MPLLSPDLILLHPPSVYDFRKKNIFYGLISDVIPSTPIFEMYPIGFITLTNYLKKHNCSVRIINIAYKMLKNYRFNVEKFINKLNPLAFGIDLHWLPHCQGSLEIAKIVKKYHPSTPIIFGGLTSTYYHKELITYPYIDYVLRGDSTEEPLLQLIKSIKRNEKVDKISNLTWKDKQGNIYINELSYVPDNLDKYEFNYFNIIKSAIKYRDITGYIPFKNWFFYPITAVFSLKGCVYNCKPCGGGNSFYQNICKRKKPAYRLPELLARDIYSISLYIKGPIFIIGDISLNSEDYINTFFEIIKKNKIKNHLILEFFKPPTYDFLSKVANSIPNFNFQISPEDYDEKIRKIVGKDYTNKDLEFFISNALKLGCKRIDVFFIIGLPEQTEEKIKQTINYCSYLLEKYRIHPYIAPLAPFLDPGSFLFEHPEEYGYKLFYKTLEEHRNALLNPSLKYILNYETKWLSREQIVNLTYQSALKLNELKLKFKLIPQKVAAKIEKQIREALDILSNGNSKIGKISTIYVQKELEWPTGFLNFRILNILRDIFIKFYD